MNKTPIFFTPQGEGKIPRGSEMSRRAKDSTPLFVENSEKSGVKNSRVGENFHQRPRARFWASFSPGGEKNPQGVVKTVKNARIFSPLFLFPPRGCETASGS